MTTKKIVTAVPRLPPELWAHALEWSTMDHVRNCASANRFFLSEVSPLIGMLTVQASSLVVHHKMFPNVETIQIDFQIRKPMELVLFLLQFPKLSLVHFGPRVYSAEGGKSITSEVIRLVCDAYATGELNSKVRFQHIIPRKGRRDPGWQCLTRRFFPQVGCSICRLVCRSFPPQQLLEGSHGAARCFPVEEQLQLAYNRAPDLKLDEALWRVLENQQQVCKLGVLWYSKKDLRHLDWLVQKGAQLQSSGLQKLMAGKAGHVDRKLFQKMCEWRWTVPQQQVMKVIDLDCYRLLGQRR